MLNDVSEDAPLIVDDFLKEESLADLSTTVQNSGWSYGWRSSKGHHYGLWHRHFAGGDKDSRTTCDEDLKNSDEHESIYKLWIKIKENHLPGYSLLRAYANGQTYGLEGGIHVDHIDGGECCTAIVYVHDNWAVPWGGELVFYSPEGEIISAVHPTPGRLIVFDSAIPHVARAPSRECPALRVSLVFKAIKDSV